MFRPFLAGLTLVAFALSIFRPVPSLQAEGIVFQTDMYGTENIPSVTTVAYGFVRFFFNDARTAADYTVDVKGYNGSQVTGADIHRGARGSNGPVVKHLADGGFIVTGGRASFSAQELQEMAAGLWYVSLKTVDYPDGALRGQIVLPAGFTPGSTGPAPGIPPLPGLPVEGQPPGYVAPSPPEVVAPPAPAPGVEAIRVSPEPAVDLSVPPPAPAPSFTDAAAIAGGIIRPPNTGSGGLLR